MTYKNIFLTTTTLFFVVSAPALAQGVSGNVGLTTDYIFRGVSQTDEAPAIQGGVDYEHDNGLHAGVWGSSVDFNNPKDGSMELDIYGGFQNEVAGFTYDVGGIYYAYPGASSSLNYDYWELYLNGGYDFGVASVNAGVNYSPEFFGKTGDATYLHAGVDVPLPSEFNLGLHIGHQNIENATDYTDWSVGVSRNWLEFDWAATYHDTDMNNVDAADSRVVFSVSKSF